MSRDTPRSPVVREKIVQRLRKRGLERARDLERLGVSREYLRRLVADGVIERVGRGLYMLPGAAISENHSLAQAGKRVPNGIICLISALRFHGLTTQAPYEVWMAIDRKARRPHIDYPPLRLVRFSGQHLISGVKRHRIEGVPVKIYEPAKTVVDCFKYRNKIGLDVALEALRDCRRQRKASMDDLWTFAKVCRVANVMRPYLESLT